MSVNKVTLLGRLGRDPEVKFTSAGLMICTFSIATTFKSKGETQTEWHDIVAYDKRAELCSMYLCKGYMVFVEGRKQTQKWTHSKYSDVTMQKCVINATDIQFTTSKKDSVDSSLQSPPIQDNRTTLNQPTDDIPF